MSAATASTVDAGEVERFSRLADTWWDEGGPFKPLHRINPVRIGYIRDRIEAHSRLSGDRVFGESGEKILPRIPEPPNTRPPLKSVSLLDIGCGGGLVCEPMARLGATVTGIDASAKNIEAAKRHAAQSGLAIDYRCMAAEELVASAEGRGPRDSSSSRSSPPAPLYDVVLALEIVEHVADVAAFVDATAKLVKPGGLLIYSTLNRTAKSFALAIVGAEYLLRWLPRGTHDWNKFLKPSELAAHLRRNKIDITDTSGLSLDPLNGKWSITRDLSVNYFMTGVK